MFNTVCLALVFALFVKSSLTFPWHASCKIEWEWPQNSCSDIETMIIDQIGKWNNTNCAEGEKCRYALVSHSALKLTATHTTPEKHYVDDLTLEFTPKKSGGCQVQAKSSSETWYAVLDYGTNYCNLENLITGAGLNKLPEYVEKTSNSDCTQYSSANCEKY